MKNIMIIRHKIINDKIRFLIANNGTKPVEIGLKCIDLLINIDPGKIGCIIHPYKGEASFEFTNGIIYTNHVQSVGDYIKTGSINVDTLNKSKMITDINEIMKLKVESELKIAEVLNNFTSKTSLNVNEVYIESHFTEAHADLYNIDLDVRLK